MMDQLPDGYSVAFCLINLIWAVARFPSNGLKDEDLSIETVSFCWICNRITPVPDFRKKGFQ